MATYNRGDLVVVLYPFSHGRGRMPRPALVVSHRAYNDSTGDLILAQVTSRINRPMFLGDYRLRDWKVAGLDVECKVRTGKLNTIAAPEVRKTIGQVTLQDLTGARLALEQILR